MTQSIYAVTIPPEVPSSAVSVRLHAFRVLVRSALGRLAWFDFQAKVPPSEQLIAAVRDRLDSVNFESEKSISNDLARFEYDFDIKFIEGDFLELDSWPVDGWIQMQALDIASKVSKVDELIQHRAAIIDRSREYLQRRLAQFKQDMDPAIAGVFDESRGKRLHVWNYMHHSDAKLSRNRAQALRSYPFLSDYICLDDFDEVRQSIDNEISLEKALSQHFRVKAALIRRIGHQSIDDLRGPFANPYWLMSFMDALPLSAVPVNRDDWQGLMVLSERVAEFIDQPINTPLGLAILVECLSKKEAMKLALSDDWHQHQNALRHLLHALVSVAGFIYQGRLSPKDANLKARSLVGKFVSRLGLRKLIVYSKQWGSVYRETVQADMGRRDAISRYRWPTLVAEPLLFGDCTATPLADIASLNAEGARMSNCVASYAADCKSGICQIWSLQSRHKPLSATLQTFVDTVHANTRPVIRLGQIEGPQSSAAAPLMMEAAKQLVASLSGQPSRLWDYLVEVERQGSHASSGQVDGFTAQALVRALGTVFGDKLSIRSVYESAMGMDFSPERFEKLIPVAINEY